MRSESLSQLEAIAFLAKNLHDQLQPKGSLHMSVQLEMSSTDLSLNLGVPATKRRISTFECSINMNIH